MSSPNTPAIRSSTEAADVDTSNAEARGRSGVSTTEALVHATFWSSLSSLTNVASQVVRGKVAAIFLGPGGVAVVTQLNSFLNFGLVIGGFGHASGAVRETSQAHEAGDWDALKRVHQTFLFVLTCSASIAMLVGLILARPVSEFLFADADYALHVRIVAVALPLSIGARFFQSIIKGYRNVAQLAKINAIGNSISVICFIFLLCKWGLVGAAVAIVVTQGLLFVLGAVYVGKNGNTLTFGRPKSFEPIRKNLGFATAGLTSGLLGLGAGMFAVRSIIASYGEQLGGVYSATWRISSVYLGLIFATTTSYYYPTIARLRSEKDIGHEIAKTLRFFQIAICPLIVILIVFHEPITRLLLSERFQQSGELLAYQLPGDMFRLAFDVFALALLAQGKVRAFVSCYVGWFVVYITAISAAIAYSNGLPSCSFAHSMTYLTFGIASYILVPKLNGWSLGPAAYRTLVLACLHVAAASLISLYVEQIIAAYSLGICVLASWLFFHLRDPMASTLIDRVTRKFSSRRK